jgi:hypothetical protein
VRLLIITNEPINATLELQKISHNGGLGEEEGNVPLLPSLGREVNSGEEGKKGDPFILLIQNIIITYKLNI